VCVKGGEDFEIRHHLGKRGLRLGRSLVESPGRDLALGEVLARHVEKLRAGVPREDRAGHRKLVVTPGSERLESERGAPARVVGTEADRVVPASRENLALVGRLTTEKLDRAVVDEVRVLREKRVHVRAGEPLDQLDRTATGRRESLRRHADKLAGRADENRRERAIVRQADERTLHRGEIVNEIGGDVAGDVAGGNSHGDILFLVSGVFVSSRLLQTRD
jgi:hypothetical protein